MISFVVLVHGFEPFVLDCLCSLHTMTGRPDTEVIVVDNGSPKEDTAALRSAIQGAGITIDQFVELADNAGFGAGMNAGIARAHGDVVVALNSDTLVGPSVARSILQARRDHPEAGFYSLPVYHAQLERGHITPVGAVQGEVVGLTWYASCLPVRQGVLEPRFVLGPPGSAVAMSRDMVNAVVKKYGAVYDPHFFLYGEDVDLYLRACELGFKTSFIRGSVEAGEVIWHVGSASTGAGAIPTIQKRPGMARLVLDGCWDNAIGHAGLVEMPLVVLMQVLFRCIFYWKYWRANSLRLAMQLLASGRKTGRPRAFSRNKVRFGPALLRRMALFHSTRFFWARAKDVPSRP